MHPGFILIFTIAIIFFIPWAIMLLWNWLMPLIFGLTTLTYWQSFGVWLLASFLWPSVGYKK